MILQYSEMLCTFIWVLCCMYFILLINIKFYLVSNCGRFSIQSISHDALAYLWYAYAAIYVTLVLHYMLYYIIYYYHIIFRLCPFAIGSEGMINHFYNDLN